MATNDVAAILNRPPLQFQSRRLSRVAISEPARRRGSNYSAAVIAAIVRACILSARQLRAQLGLAQFVQPQRVAHRRSRLRWSAAFGQVAKCEVWTLWSKISAGLIFPVSFTGMVRPSRVLINTIRAPQLAQIAISEPPAAQARGP